MKPANSPAPGQIRPGAVARDVAILWVLTLVGGVVAGIASQPGTARFAMAVAVSNILLSTIGFVIVGCLVGGRRWKHLAVVTVVLWLTGLINTLFGVTLAQWFLSIILLFIVMGIGGSVSYLFRK